MKVHELKCRPDLFIAIHYGWKRWECRLNDRDYQLGDLLLLKPFPLTTNDMGMPNSILCKAIRITTADDLTAFGNPLAPDWVIMDIERIKLVAA